MLKTALKLCLYFCILPYTLTLDAAGSTDTEITPFPIPEHGEIIFQVPLSWDYTYFSLGETRPPVITFFRKDPAGKEIFQLNVSLLWDDGFERNILRDDNVRKLVEEVGEDILQFSDETELLLEHLEGKEGQGYFFDLSDSSARPGEYRYLTQGALGVGEVLLVFSLFTNDPEGQIREIALEMITTALLKLQRHVRSSPFHLGIAPDKEPVV